VKTLKNSLDSKWQCGIFGIDRRDRYSNSSKFPSRGGVASQRLDGVVE